MRGTLPWYMYMYVLHSANIYVQDKAIIKSKQLVVINDVIQLVLDPAWPIGQDHSSNKLVLSCYDMID